MSRKKKHEEHENLERWLVSYADFITLLFAFFTVMYALGMQDKKNYKEAIENIQRAFQSAGGVFPLKGQPFVPYKSDQGGSQVPPSEKDAGKLTKTQQENMERVAEQIRGLFEASTGINPGKSDVEVVKTAGGYKLRLGEAMMYNSGGDKLKRETLPFLYELGKRLGALGYPIQIEGHADNLERPKNAEGSRSPWQLSLSRSVNMAQFLVEGTGFPQQMISVAGFGDTQPLSENDTQEGRLRNRRVEISINTPDREISNLPW